MGGFIKYAVEMGSGAVMYIPSFINIGSTIQKLMGDTQTHRQHGDHIRLLSFFFQNKYAKSRLCLLTAYATTQILI
jgi:hypothetical protein